MTDNREWTIKGWEHDGLEMTIADGPVPAINESIEVVPKSRLKELEDLYQAREAIREMSGPPLDKEQMQFILSQFCADTIGRIKESYMALLNTGDGDPDRDDIYFKAQSLALELGWLEAKDALTDWRE